MFPGFSSLRSCSNFTVAHARLGQNGSDKSPVNATAGGIHTTRRQDPPLLKNNGAQRLVRRIGRGRQKTGIVLIVRLEFERRAGLPATGKEIDLAVR